VSVERITKLWQRLKSQKWNEEFQQSWDEMNLWSENDGRIQNKYKKIFSNSHVRLRNINAYGFDYDYTLACYNDEAEALIYNNILDFVVKEFGYPKELLKCEYDPDFVTKGIQFDSNTGCFLKLDQFYKLGHSTVFHGRRKLDIEEVTKLYGGRRLSLDYVNQHIRMLADSFCIPWGSALADIVDLLTERNIKFDPKLVDRDVRDAVSFVHTSGVFHNSLIKHPENFIDLRPDLAEFFKMLKNQEKNIFIVTNSKLNFVSAGCEFLLEETKQLLGVRN